MEELSAAGGADCATNQILYNVAARPRSSTCCPYGGGSRCRRWPIARSNRAGCRIPDVLTELARKYRATPFQIALAWVLTRPDVIAIPKAASIDHVKANRGALDLRLDAEALAALDRAFPPPRRKTPLAML